MEIYNLNGDEWNLETEHEDYVFKDCWVGARIGAELIGGSMYEVAPGKKQGPYHTHHGNEEWAAIVILLEAARPGWQQQARWLREHGQELHDFTLGAALTS